MEDKMTDYDLALFNLITAVGTGDEVYIKELTDTGAELRKEISKVQEKVSTFTDIDYVYSCEEEFVEGCKKVFKLLELYEVKDEAIH